MISPTKIRTYKICPAMYRLEYVDKLGRFYHRARAGFAFGHSLHRALDTFHHAGGAAAVTPEELTASLGDLWVAKGYDNPEQAEQFREEGERILQAYHQAHVKAETERAEAVEAGEVPPPPPHLLFTEKTLRMDLSPDVALSGRVDRVDEHHDGSLEIVDYKSGRATVTEEDVAASLAMNIYQVLLKHKEPTRRVFATIVALRSGDRASHEMSEDEHESLTAECLETGETLRTKDWENVLPVLNDYCPHCDFLPHCTKFWERQARRRKP